MRSIQSWLQNDVADGVLFQEKVSYDDYNLACIITFPPFQKRGFGTLMIEFSELVATFPLVCR